MQRPTMVSLDTAERLLAEIVAAAKRGEIPKGLKNMVWGAARLGDQCTLRRLLGGKTSWKEKVVAVKGGGASLGLDGELEGGWSILCAASQGGHEAAVKELLDAGADPNSVGTPLGGTPLCVAAMAGHEGVVELLIAAGADVDRSRAGDGATPLFLAAARGHGGVVERLILAGADVERSSSDDGATPLLVAVERGRLGVVDVLLEAGADPSASRRYSGATPLHHAASQGLVAVVEQLLRAGADPSKAMRGTGLTPLFMAAQHGHGDIVEQLLNAKDGGAAEGGDDSNAEEVDNGDSALVTAVLEGHRCVAMVLLEHGASYEGILDLRSLQRLMGWMAEELEEKDRVLGDKETHMRRLVWGIPEWCTQAAASSSAAASLEQQQQQQQQ